MVSPRPVVAGGQDAALRRMLAIDPQKSGGWVLSAVRAEPHFVRARYERSGSSPVEIELRHPEDAIEPSVKTDRFSIAFGEPGGPRELLAVVRQRVAEGESSFAWHVPSPGVGGKERPSPPKLGFAEIERIAFFAGAKPALRVHVPAEQVGPMVEKLAKKGYYGSEFRSRWPPRRLLFVARSQHVASRLSQLETVLSRDGLYRSRHCIDAVREIGLLLGYPACCVQSFTERYRQSPHPLLPRSPALAYLAARAAWVPRPRHLLNDLLGATGACYISFEPCRYDCEAALELAAATARAVEEQNPEARSRIDERLACHVLVLGSGERGVVELGEGRVISTLEPVPAPGGVGRGERPLPRFLGAEVRSDGTVAGATHAIVLSFRAPTAVEP